MKIVILQDDFPPHSTGGAGIVAYTLARSLVRHGHEVLVLTTSRNEADVIEHEGFRIHTIATAYNLRFQAYISLWNIPVTRKVKKILQEFKPDVVHAHNVHGYLSYRSLVIAKRLGSRVILTCHDVMSFNYTKLTDFIDPNNLSVPVKFDYRVSAWHQLRINRFRYNPFRNIIIRYILQKYVDKILAVSDALCQALGDNGIGNVAVVYNAIDVKEWEELPDTINDFKKDHGLGNAVVLFGGRLTGVKGGGKLLEALSNVVQIIPEVQLLVIGKKDTYAEKMLTQAEQIGLSGKIIFTGWISGHELHRAYHAAALVVFPSLCFDAFGLVNIEAMACKNPVIATCFGGSREVVRDSQTGYIVNPYDVPTMAEKIKELLLDTEKRTRFGTAGYERVVSEFALAKQAEVYERFYKGLDV